MKIRKAKLKDSNFILTLIESSPELQGIGDKDPVYSKEYITNCIQDKKMNLVLVIEVENKIGGFLISEIWKKKKYSFLIDIFILEKYRSKGFGEKLYNFYEEYCKKMKLKTIVMLVKQDNLNMQKFCNKKEYLKGNPFFMYEKEI